MNSFKLSGTAIALVMAGSIPALAQDATTMVMPERVLVQIEGTNSAYRLPYAVAAELCGDVDPAVLETLADDADVIYCSIADTVVVEQNFADNEEFEFFEDLNEASEPTDVDEEDDDDEETAGVEDDDEDEESGDNGEDGGTDGTAGEADGNSDIDVDLDGTDNTQGGESGGEEDGDGNTGDGNTDDGDGSDMDSTDGNTDDGDADGSDMDSTGG